MESPGSLGMDRDRVFLRLLSRYPAAVGIAVAAHLLRQVLVSFSGTELPPFVTFYPGVMLAAVWLGLGPGIVATGVSAVSTFYWIYVPRGRFEIGHTADAVGLGVFVAMGVCMSIVAGQYRRNRHRAVEYQRQLDARQSSEALRQSEDRWQFALEGAGDGVWDWNAVTDEVFFSRQWKAMLGYEEHEIGNTFDEWKRLVHPDDRQPALDEIARHFRNETSVFAVEHRLRCKDGTYKWIATRGKLFARTPDGRPLRVIGVHTDISEHRRAEEALLRERGILDGIMRSTDVMLVRLDRDFNFVAVNPAYAAACRKRPEELIGRNHFDLYPHAENESIFRRVRDTGEPVFFKDKPFVFPDQPERGVTYWDWSLIPVKDSLGTVSGLVFSLRETTETWRAKEALRESEEWHRTASDAAELGAWWHDVGTNIIHFDKRAMAHYGFTESVIDEQQVIARFHPDEVECVRREIAAAQDPAAGSGNWHADHRIVLPNGEVRWLACHIHADFAGEGAARRAVRSFGTTQDITERKRAEQERESLRAQLEQSQKMESIGRLAGGVAHDFNNLLTVINGYGDLVLSQMKAGDPLQSSVQEMRAAGEKAAALTQQLLAFGRKQLLQPRLLNIDTVVRNLHSMLRRLVGEDIEVRLTLGTAEAVVLADPHQIEQVILNLAVNSRDAMPRGGKLAIETAKVEWNGECAQANPEARPGRFVMLEVSDDGIGMDPTTRSRIFEPFFTTKGVGQGSGLGLSMVHGIVAQSGGWIDVDSEPGRGTSFRVYLPQAAGTADAETGAPQSETHGANRATVLVVEDQPEVRQYVAAALDAYGYRVVVAGDLDEAMSSLEQRSEPVDLILSDVVMPTSNGRDLAEGFEKVRPGVKILFMSGYTDDVVVRHGVVHGGVDFLQKPFSPAQLANKVAEVLKISR